MRVVLAPDSFKGSLSAAGVASALAEGWQGVRPTDQLMLRPMADGGEGTLAAMAAALPKVETRSIQVFGADLQPRAGSWLLLPKLGDEPTTAVVELASVCGIEGLKQLAPMTASTFGLGQAIAAAVQAGARRVLVGLGSSASTDGGAGMLAALGVKLCDASGALLPPGGAALSQLTLIDTTGLIDLEGVELIGLTDVSNPLLGELGAASVFGPQKGASPQQVGALDVALTRFSEIAGTEFAAGLESAAEPGLAAIPGAGAAGGTGFGLLLLGAQLQSGADMVAELIGLKAACAGADVVVTGEGRFDSQSAAGKVPSRVHDVARGALARNLALVAGQVSADANTSGFDQVVSLTHLAGSEKTALAEPERWLRKAAFTLASAFGG